jgi:hypothetical protein
MADNLLEYRDLAKANSFPFNLDLILFSKTVMRPTKFFSVPNLPIDSSLFIV